MSCLPLAPPFLRCQSCQLGGLLRGSLYSFAVCRSHGLTRSALKSYRSRRRPRRSLKISHFPIIFRTLKSTLNFPNATFVSLHGRSETLSHGTNLKFHLWFVSLHGRSETHPLQTPPVIHISRLTSRKRAGQGDACPINPTRYRGLYAIFRASDHGRFRV